MVGSPKKASCGEQRGGNKRDAALSARVDAPRLSAVTARIARRRRRAERRSREFGDSSRELGTGAGSVETGLNHSDIPPGKLNCPLHCHASEEEVFVVLEGDGVCILGEHPVRVGSVVARPPRTRVGHAFRAGPDRMKLLAYGTREPNDIACSRCSATRRQR